jgi:hypothetical protein
VEGTKLDFARTVLKTVLLPVLIIICTTVFATSLLASVDEGRSEFQYHSIYGNDDRHEFYEVANPLLRRHFQSVVALFQKDYYKATFNGIDLAPVTPIKEQNLCPTERFADQISAASCTGALVAPNIVLTAGLCFQTVEDCKSLVVAFDYLIPAPGHMPTSIPSSKVYGCKRVIAREVKKTGLDYALVELDRIVYDRPYFQFDLSRRIQNGDSLFVIGHPMGVPAKIVSGFVNQVREPVARTDLDTYQGNSGSPVFNSNSGLIVGVLVEGEEDFVPNGKCNVSRHCKPGNDCAGEFVNTITSIVESYHAKAKP